MFVWTPDMIRFMQAANEKSDYHARLAAILTPKLSGCRTLCDAGCGLGALSAALSPSARGSLRISRRCTAIC